jgi:SAM-dependent methyltransferase
MATDPRLAALEPLVGEWATEMTHPMLPELVVHGSANFSWLEGGRFLLQRATTDHPDFPDSLWVIGLPSAELGEDPASDLTFQYFDSRGVHRIYHGHMADRVFTWWRDHPGFDQRFVGTLDDAGDVLAGQGRMRRDDGEWEDDLAITYRRVRHAGAHHHGHHRHEPAQWSAPELAGYLAGAGELPSTALDLGCGSGGDAVFLATLGIATTGVDQDAAALERAAVRADEAGVHVTWIEGDVLDLALDDASFDLATDRGCLHHVAAAHQPRYALEVARVLRPGGRLLVREHNHPGHDELAVTDESIRAMIAGTPLELVSSVPFAASGGHGAGGRLWVLRRDHERST